MSTLKETLEKREKIHQEVNKLLREYEIPTATNRDEVVEEMATIHINNLNKKGKIKLHIFMQKENRYWFYEGAYFKLGEEASEERCTRLARIHFLFPAYDLHYKDSSKQKPWFLKTDEKKALMQALGSPSLYVDPTTSYHCRTVWEELIFRYNEMIDVDKRFMINFDIEKDDINKFTGFIPLTLPITNYELLPDNAIKNQEVKDKHGKTKYIWNETGTKRISI